MLAALAVVLGLPSLLQEPGSPAGAHDPPAEGGALAVPARAPARVERTLSSAGAVARSGVNQACDRINAHRLS